MNTSAANLKIRGGEVSVRWLVISRHSRKKDDAPQDGVPVHTGMLEIDPGRAVRTNYDLQLHSIKHQA